ncbi:trypsin-like peptidase domain-containing protein [Myxococcaceae bacterium JPH2]|nr:trypsin-like peptidase domain-containing protein [Myxococcaceae bacterium JPH2]
MKRFVLGGSVLVFSVSCASASRVARLPVEEAGPPSTLVSARPSRKEMVRRILPHNVRLIATDGGEARRTASGVVVGTERTEKGVASFVLTNAHAVVTSDLKAPALKIVIDGRGDATEYPAEVVASGEVPALDLALLRVSGVALPAVALADDDELEPGEDVVVAASPYGRALSISGGMVSQVEWDAETKRPRMLKTDAPIGYGASGGGIFSLETGRLLAIVEGYRTAQVGFEVAEQAYSFDVPMPGETFAAPTAKVRGFLEAKGFGRLLAPGEGSGSQPTAHR